MTIALFNLTRFDRFKLVRENYMLVAVLRRVLGEGMKNVADHLVKDYSGSAANEHFLHLKGTRAYVPSKQCFAISHKVDYPRVLLLTDGQISLCQVYS